jgi:DNA-binding beta-propeller fold protein YncE
VRLTNLYPRHRRSNLLATALTFALAATAAVSSAPSTSAPLRIRSVAVSASALHDVVLIGNSVSGTVSFLDGRSFANLGSINVTADAAQVLTGMNPIDRLGYEMVKSVEKGIRYVDDLYVSKDGRTLYVSRGELQDVVAFDIATRRQIWRTKVEGFKTDHAVLSPDGTQLIVSATTAQKAYVLSTQTGAVITSFGTGTYPHANDYSPDGKYLYNSSIGITSMPYALNGLKGSKQLEVVDPKTYKVLKTYSFEYGVRPAVFTSDNKTMYVNFSYLNGFAEVDLATGKITKTVKLPFSTAGKALAFDNYPQNSAHHGMAMNAEESKLCDVGTIDDYTAIISRPALTADHYVTYPTGSVPYWSTTSVDGAHCLVSLAGRNEVSVVDYTTGAEIARTAVGQYPQRERLAQIPDDVLSTLDRAQG